MDKKWKMVVMVWGWAAVASARAADVTVSWSANAESDLAGYRLYYGGSSLLSMTPAQAMASTSVTKVDVIGARSRLVTGLAAGGSFFFRVTALNAAGEESAFSTNPPEISTSIPSAPPVPGGLTAAAVAPGQIRLTWTDVAGETGYQLQWSLSPSFSAPVAVVRAANVTSYDHTSLPAGTLYYYRVLARNASGDSAYSPSVTARTLDGDAPQPQGYAAVDPEVRLLSPRSPDGRNDSVVFDSQAREVLILRGDGREVAALESASWGGLDGRGRPLPSGVYIARITAKDGSVAYQKILLMR